MNQSEDLKVEFKDLCGEEWDEESKPFLDRDLSPVDEANLSDDQLNFRRDGILFKQGLIPNDLIDRYCKLREKLKDPGGWNMPCPYLHYDEIKDISLYSPMMKIMWKLIGHHMSLHLNLTGWVSTERNWHQDDYLNPEHVKSHYIAVWIALDDIHRDSGPFQFVRGSNWWPCIKQSKVFEIMKKQGIEPSDPLWPTKTQDWVAGACADEIWNRKAKVEAYLPKKGDVLFWHGRLVHRGSPPIRKGMQRKALICHYSSIDHRPDFPPPTLYRSKDGRSIGYYFDTKMPLEGPQRV